MKQTSWLHAVLEGKEIVALLAFNVNSELLDWSKQVLQAYTCKCHKVNIVICIV